MPVWQMKQKLQARRRKEIKAQSGQQHSHSRVGYTVLSRQRAASVRSAGESTRRALFEYLQQSKARQSLLSRYIRCSLRPAPRGDCLHLYISGAFNCTDRDQEGERIDWVRLI